MNEIREIVTKAVVAKGKKTIKFKDVVIPINQPFSILGCWVINHRFDATLCDNIVDITGNFEIDVWYTYNDNQGTDIARKTCNYEEKIRTREIVKDVNPNTKDVIVRIIQQPTCTNACIQDNDIIVDIIFEVIAEIIGEAKMIVSILTPINTCEDIDDDFENEINENFINEN